LVKSHDVNVVLVLFEHVTSTAKREPAQGAAPKVASLESSVHDALPTQAAATVAETSLEHAGAALSALQ
jgi:hypothetical protein